MDSKTGNYHNDMNVLNLEKQITKLDWQAYVSSSII
jgi:hypothetical protein